MARRPESSGLQRFEPNDRRERAHEPRVFGVSNPQRRRNAFFKEIILLIGRFAEWLGAGLQNQLQRFESATDLNKIPFREAIGDFFIPTEPGLPE